MRFLPAHVEQLAPWAPRVQEIIVVDSESSDGTVEFLRKQLRHPKVQFLGHPPGLYESWNFGISKVRAEFTYISTIGDTITEEGLTHLCSTCETLKSDLCVSPPRFIKPGTTEEPRVRWPIHELMAALRITGPQTINPRDILYFAVKSGLRSVLGSSASNIYRTRVLQEHPFPTQYKSIGDTAWGLLYAHQCHFGVTPNVCASFLLHDCQHKQDIKALTEAMFALARKVVAEALASPVNGAKAWFPDLMLEIASYTYYRRCVQVERLRSIPWFLNPIAWQMRLQRNRHRERIETRKREIEALGDIPDYLQDELLRFKL